MSRSTRALGEARHVTCPGCGARVAWIPASTYRPFCSARCRSIDFGAWAGERYRVGPAGVADSDDIALDGAGDVESGRQG